MSLGYSQNIFMIDHLSLSIINFFYPVVTILITVYSLLGAKKLNDCQFNMTFTLINHPVPAQWRHSIEQLCHTVMVSVTFVIVSL